MVGQSRTKTTATRVQHRNMHALMGLTLLSVIAPFTSNRQGRQQCYDAHAQSNDSPVIRPTVSITSPGQFAVFTVSAPIQIVAAASISSGSITRVEFQAIPNSGTNPLIPLGTDTSGPLQCHLEQCTNGCLRFERARVFRRTLRELYVRENCHPPLMGVIRSQR